MQLRSMSVDRLMDLREKVEIALKTRIAGARSDLETRLKALSGVGRSERAARRGPRGRVPPKYRNPDNPAETWTGRGLPPRWLAAALKKRGRRLEDFLIEGAPRRRRKMVTKTRKTKAARKQTRPGKAAKARKPLKARKAMTLPKAVKRRKAAKPLKTKIARRPRAISGASPPAPAPAPTPAPVDQTSSQAPTA
jgi:DNA-binding protein H-NS